MSWNNTFDDNPFADPSVADVAHNDTARLNPNTKNSSQPTDTPAWLQDSEPAWAAPAQAPQQYPTQPVASYQEPAKPVDPAVPKMVMYTRIANMILSVGMGIAAGLNLASTDLTVAVMACYVLAFACLICCYETHLKQVHLTIAVNFGFLYNAKGRIVFLLFVGLMLFNLGLIGVIVASAMMANLAFHVYILFRYPEFEEYQRKDAQAEIREYLDSHPELSDKVVRAGVDYAANNPDLVRKGAEAYLNSQRSSGAYKAPGAYP